MTVAGANAAVDHQDVAIKDFRSLHTVALHWKEEGRDWIAYQVLVDVEACVLVICSR